MDDRRMMLKRLQSVDFALDEIGLYLDTHPDDKMALQHYSQYQKLRAQAAAEYMSKYGPLEPMNYDGGPTWRWVDNPWPWENE